jgi:MFS family permease
MFRRFTIATVAMFFQQWTGINTILYYASKIFGSLGLSSNTVSLLDTSVISIVMFLATIPAVMYVDMLGRKPVLIADVIGIASCHLIVAGISSAFEDSWESRSGAWWASLVMIWLFVIHFGCSWGPCSWIVIAEIWPLLNRPYSIALGPRATG